MINLNGVSILWSIMTSHGEAKKHFLIRFSLLCCTCLSQFFYWPSFFPCTIWCSEMSSDIIPKLWNAHLEPSVLLLSTGLNSPYISMVARLNSLFTFLDLEPPLKTSISPDSWFTPLIFFKNLLVIFRKDPDKSSGLSYILPTRHNILKQQL